MSNPRSSPTVRVVPGGTETSDLTEYPFKLGTTIGDYKLLSVLGRGSFGTVYLAEEKLLQREVALKVCPEDLLEGKTIAQLEHEGIVRVHSQKVLNGYCVIDMQYVPSMTLHALINQLKEFSSNEWTGRQWIEVLERKVPSSQLSVAQFRCREQLLTASASAVVASVGLQIAEALSFAHSKEILHLDIKPENILIHPSGKAYVMDFNVSTTQTDLLKGVPKNYGGTFQYMSPEQMSVFFASDRKSAIQDVNGTSDVYSLGLVLTEVLDTVQIKNWDCYALKSILAKASETSPADRYRDMDSMRSALQSFLRLQKIKSTRPALGPILGWTKKYPIVGLTVVGGVPQLFASLVGYFYNYSQVIEKLGPSQVALFNQINIYYGVFTFILGMGLWLRALRKLTNALKDSKGFLISKNVLHRKELLSIPFWGAGVAAISWLPGAILFPWIIGSQNSGIGSLTLMHLSFSFALSFLIAFTYTFIAHALCALVAFYDDFLLGETGIQETVQKELVPLYSKLSVLTVLASIIPLFGILSVIIRNDTVLDAKAYGYFRALLVILVSPGTFGIWFAVHAKEQIRLLIQLFRE